MAEITVNDELLNSQAAKDYFSRADSRVMIGVRAVLEMLSIPVPEYAKRKPTGRPPSRAVTAAFKVDHPGEHTRSRPAPDAAQQQRRVKAAVAKMEARNAKRAAEGDTQGAPSLYDLTFNG